MRPSLGLKSSWGMAITSFAFPAAQDECVLPIHKTARKTTLRRLSNFEL
jgi:hypothetical protein